MTTRSRPRDTHRLRFKWQRGLIVWLVFSSHPPTLSGNPDTAAYARVCSSLDHRCFAGPTPFSFSSARCPVLRHPSQCFRVVFFFFEFSFAVRQNASLRSCFSRVPAFFLLPCFWRNLANIPSSWIPSRPIDRGFEWQTCPALSMSVRCFFAIDHPPPFIVKFDEKQRLHDDREQWRVNASFS